MEAVARTAGVTKPVIYGLFPGRSALYAALLDREEARALGQLSAVVPNELGNLAVDELVATSIRSLATAVRARPSVWSVLLAAPDSLPIDVRERYARRRAEIVAAVLQLIHAGHGSPAIGDDELAAESLVALGELAARLTLRAPDQFGPERLGDFFGALAAGMLGGMPTREPTRA